MRKKKIPFEKNASFITKNLLYFIVFITGACVLVIEILATRILSPYYGNTIYTFSSVISVILAALSVGYFIGGRLSHKYTPYFYHLILISGISIFFLQLVMLLFLPKFGYVFSIIEGPLITSIILFFLPGFLLGMLSPLAVELQKKIVPDENVGKIAGTLFFSSTTGSIVGSLLSGFVLIPVFGIDKIILSVGVVLSVLGALGVFLQHKRIHIFAVLGIVVLFSLVTSLIVNIKTRDNIVYLKDGVYERLLIYDTLYNGKKARYFSQDAGQSGAAYLESNEPVFEYVKYYRLYEIIKPEIEEALVIGGGNYTIPKILVNELPGATIDVVEIEPSLFKLSQKYFDVEKNKRLVNHVEDGRRFLYDSDKKYDYIFTDAYYSIFSVPSHLTTKEFFLLAKSKMTPNGVFIANFQGDPRNLYPNLLISEIKTFRTVFQNSYFFAVEYPNNKKMQNIIILGINGEKEINFEKLNKNKESFFAELEKKRIDISKYKLKDHIELTDNYAPVEYLTSINIQRAISTK